MTALLDLEPREVGAEEIDVDLEFSDGVDLPLHDQRCIGYYLSDYSGDVWFLHTGWKGALGP